KTIGGYGVKVQNLRSRGSLGTLQRLADPNAGVDVGFVQGGLGDGIDTSHLMSLGSMFGQPLMVYHRLPDPIDRLSELRGKKLAIGPEGSGTRALALKLLAANDIDATSAEFVDLAGEDAANALVAGQIDAAFLSSDSATGKVMRSMRDAGMGLVNFKQANGYVRRFRFLSKEVLPEGVFD